MENTVAAASQKDAKSIEKIEKTTASELRAQSLKKSTKIFDGRLSLRKREEEVVSDDKPPNTELESNHSTEPKKRLSSIERFVARASDMLTGAGLAYFLTLFILMLVDDSVEAVYGAGPCGCLVASFFLSGVVSLRDRSRSKFSKVHRVLHALSAFIIGLGVVIRISMTSESLSNIDIASTAVLMAYLLVVLLECRIIRYPETAKSDKKARLSTRSILIVLKPYFWPDATATSATLNRIRAVSTWVFVVASKACGLLAPIYIGRASTELTRWNWEECILNVVWFSLLTFASAFLKEAQSLVYLKVAQVAFVQLAEISFSHLHGLSLDWHLRKKLGEVLRGMSRGISACDTLVKYLFLWLVPAIGECFLVAVIFSLYFDDLTLAVTVFFFVFAYMLLTVLLTLWRKKFRKQVARSDNDWNDVATDSLINFETVKYFTAEEFEKKKFGEAVLAFQKGNVNVAASLSALNTAQRFLLQACLVTALSIVVLSIRDRARCCVASGCEVGDFDCCDTLEAKCVGNKIGDFVAVLTYTINLFTPLNFLGSVYNMIVMAVVDLQNLSELLAEKADVQDAKDALELPKANPIDPDSVIEFDNVHFHYPSQPESSGLKGVSFKMKKGTTTAIVGSTGTLNFSLSVRHRNYLLFLIRSFVFFRSWKDNHFAFTVSFLRCDWWICSRQRHGRQNAEAKVAPRTNWCCPTSHDFV